MKNFDELFNEFFNGVRKSGKAEVDKLIETIEKFKSLKNEEDLEREIQNELGEPHETYRYKDDGFQFIKQVWNTPHGQFVKIIATDDLDEIIEEPVKTLQQQLDAALEVEDYLEAARLRDLIKKEK
jgi:CHASE3 domain sensor protein